MEGMGWATVLAFGLYTKECGLPDSGRHIVMWAVYSFFCKAENLKWFMKEVEDTYNRSLLTERMSFVFKYT